MKLVIVESPTKAKTLSKILSNEYEVQASMGHIRDLPKSGLGVDVDHNFAPEYVVPDKSKKTLADLKKLVSKAETVILAPDPDREGEAIAWHLKELLKDSTTKPSSRSKKPKKETISSVVDGLQFYRVVFHELTPSALREAFEHLGDINMNLVDAQQARRILDRLVGYKLSPLLWKKVRFGLSAGRVQSVAVRLIVERERERDAFKPIEYWSVDGDFIDTKGKRAFKSSLVQKDGKKIEISSEDYSTKIVKELKTDDFKISDITKTEKKKSAYPPLKTSTLQQTMANAFGFSAKKTMSAAQKLFEYGYITYHRTDSLNLSPQFIGECRKFVSTKFGAEMLPLQGIMYKTKEKNAQEAHEAIRPTDVYRVPDSIRNLTPELRKVYLVIWKRAVESQMVPAVYDSTSMEVLSKKGYLFRATGSVIKFPGWLAVDDFLSVKEEDEELAELPVYVINEQVDIENIDPQQHFTQPPARFSDASLIKTLEELGIGRPSTYAPTISTIQERGYVTKDGRYFTPTDVAYVVNDLLVKHFSDIVDYQFTAKMEEDLDDIADGKKEWVPIIREFYTPFEKTLKIKEKELSKQDVTNLGTTDEKCPDCGKPLIIKLGKYGKFLSCSGYPDCEYASPVDEDKVWNEHGEEVEDFGKCPNCETGVFVIKMGRFGKFLACSNYPKCKTTKPFLEKIGIKCPKCKTGDVVVKKAKRMVFFGCSNYPDCDFSSWKDPRSPGFEYSPNNSSNSKGKKGKKKSTK